METKLARIQFKRKTSSEWVQSNEILLDSEIGVVKDAKPKKFKLGDGVTPWNSLPFTGGEPADLYNIQSQTKITAWGDSFFGGVGNINVITIPTLLTDMSGLYVRNKGYSGQTSAYILQQFLSDTVDKGSAVIICMGRNNIVNVQQVKDNIAAMVAALPNNNYLIESVFNSVDDSQETYNNVISLNAYLSQTYGDRFLDLRSYIVSQYDPTIPQDVLDHSNDVAPSSLRWDTIHLNTAGNQLCTQKFYEKFNILFGNSDKYLTADNIKGSMEQVGVASLKDGNGDFVTFKNLSTKSIKALPFLGATPANSDAGSILIIGNSSLATTDKRLGVFAQNGVNLALRLFTPEFQIRAASDGGSLFSLSSAGAGNFLNSVTSNAGAFFKRNTGAEAPSTVDIGVIMSLYNTSISGAETRVLTTGQLNSDVFFRSIVGGFNFLAANGTISLLRVDSQGNAELLRNFKSKRINLGPLSDPTALIHIGGGTTAAGSAPIKINEGFLMTTPENGAIERTNARLFFTPSSGTREGIAHLSDIPKAAAPTTTNPASVTKTSTNATASYTQADIQKMVDDMSSVITQLNATIARQNEIISKLQAANLMA